MRTMQYATGLVMATLVFMAGIGPAKAAAQSSTGGLKLFDGAGFTATETLTESSVPDLARIGWANKVSSLSVLGGKAVAAYSQPDYRGTCETFTSQDRWLGDNAIGNDTIRSVKVGYTCFGAVPGRVVVTDVSVITGSTPGIACPRGYTKKQQDLNQGAGGDYVYLCVQWGPRTTEQFTRRVEVYRDVTADRAQSACSNDGGRPIAGDLNSGAGGGDKLRFCLFSRTKPEADLALRDLDFVVSDDDMVCYTPFFCNDRNSDRDISAACASKLGGDAYGYDDDINLGVGGKYIYLCVKSTDVPVPITHVDNSPPTITMIDRTPSNAAGWNRSNVTVTWRCAAGGSPLTTPAIVTDTLRDDGTNQSAVGVCTDLAGHETTAKQTGINIDTRPPDAQLLSRTASNAAGWNQGDVVVRWTCRDNRSGPEQDTISATVRGEGADRTANGTCRDLAGNPTPVTAGGIDIDRTPPTLRASATSDGRTYTPRTWTRHDVVVTFDCDDQASGVAGVTAPETLSTSGANQSVAGRCTDAAGNSATLDFEGANIDKIAPVLSCKAQLSPSKGGLIGVNVTVGLTDEGSGAAGYVLDSTEGGEGDIVGFDIGTPDTEGSLRDDGSDHTYTFTYRGSDAVGNVSTCDVRVQVTHDEG